MTEEIINLLAGLAALAAVVVAVLEYRRVRHERAESERAEVDGVAVEWHPSARPNHAEQDGTAIWKYKITVHNPGRLPIREVVVVLTFPVDVRRKHYDGALDDASRTVRLSQPVIIAGGTRTWHRWLQIDFRDRHQLHRAAADVTFTPLRGHSRTNHWGNCEPTEGSTA